MRFLTNQPTPVELRVEDGFSLSFFSDSTAAFLRVEGYSGGAMVFLDFIPLLPPALESLRAVSVGPKALQFSTYQNGGTFSPAALDSYKVCLSDTAAGTFNQLSEYYEFRIERGGACLNSAIRIFFQNALGGVDSYNFNAVGESRVSLENLVVERPEPLPYSRASIIESRFAIDKKQTFRIENERLDLARAEWLRELVETPVAAIQAINESGFAFLIPIRILNVEEYSFYSTESEQINFSVEFSLSRPRK